MTDRLVVQRSNNPWENLRRLRLLKKISGCKYTPGLINRDPGWLYVAIRGKIYCDGCYAAAGGKDILHDDIHYTELSTDVKKYSDYDFKSYFKSKIDDNIYTKYTIDLEVVRVKKIFGADFSLSDDYWTTKLDTQTSQCSKYSYDELYDTREDALKAQYKEKQEQLESLTKKRLELTKIIVQLSKELKQWELEHEDSIQSSKPRQLQDSTAC